MALTNTKRTYTRQELWDFVWRANTPDRITKAEKWLTDHVQDIALWDDLMVALSIQSRNYYRAKEGRELI